MEYPTDLFIEIIESIPGVQFLRADSKDDIQVRFYQGQLGNLCMVNTTDEYITFSDGIGYLLLLGLDHLIDSLFPEPNDAEEAQKAESMKEHEEFKETALKGI